MLLVYPKTRHECLYHVSHRMRGRTLTVVLTRHACFAKRRTHTCFRVFQLALLRNPSRRHEKMAEWPQHETCDDMWCDIFATDGLPLPTG